MEKERRKHKRINKTMAVQIEDSYGMLIDMSKGGMRIIPDELPKTIEDIGISFITEDGEPIELRGSIVRIVDRKEKEGKYELGLTIPKSPENYRKYIEALEKDESPSGIFQENVRQDLVQAVLEGKEEDLSIPKSEAPEAPPPAPHEVDEEDNVNIPLEELLHEELEPDFLEPILPESRDTPPKKTGDIPVDKVSPESQQAEKNEIKTPDMPPVAAGEDAPQEIVNIPLDEMLQVDRQFEEENVPFDETVAMPVNNELPPLDKPAPQEIVNVPLDEEVQPEPQPEAAETPSPVPQEFTPDETIVMPANRLPYQAPPPDDAGSSSSGKKKAAPRRVEVSFEEFLQKNPQINKPVAPPPLPKTPPPEDESSLNKVFHGEPQPGQPATPESPGKIPPTLDEESLDRAFKESQQPGPPLDTPGPGDDLSLNGIFTGDTPSGPAPKAGEKPEEDMSLDEIFKEQDKS